MDFQRGPQTYGTLDFHSNWENPRTPNTLFRSTSCNHCSSPYTLVGPHVIQTGQNCCNRRPDKVVLSCCLMRLPLQHKLTRDMCWVRVALRRCVPDMVTGTWSKTRACIAACCCSSSTLAWCRMCWLGVIREAVSKRWNKKAGNRGERRGCLW